MSNPNTIPTTSTDDERRKLWRNKLRDGRKSVTIDAGQKFSVVLIKLHPDVQQPQDYAALGAAIMDVTGIVGVELMVDGRTYDSVPEGDQLEIVATAAIRQSTIRVPEPVE